MKTLNSLEFTTKIEHGVINLPKEFEDYENAIAHVTITLETPEVEHHKVMHDIMKDEYFWQI